MEWFMPRDAVALDSRACSIPHKDKREVEDASEAYVLHILRKKATQESHTEAFWL